MLGADPKTPGREGEAENGKAPLSPAERHLACKPSGRQSEGPGQ